MKLYAAIDLHSNNSVLVVQDEEDRVVCEQRLPNKLSAILPQPAPYKERGQGVAVESTFNWCWLVDGLMDAGYEVKLVNTAAVKQYEGIKYTGDEHDARHLEHLLRLGILPTGYIQPKEDRAVRGLLRCLDERIAGPEAVVLKRGKLKPEFRRLLTVDGIRRILGMTIMYEAGEMSRFKKVGHFSSYARCVGSSRWSNGKKKAKTNRIVAAKAVAHKLARACCHVLKDGTSFDEARAFA